MRKKKEKCEISEAQSRGRLGDGRGGMTLPGNCRVNKWGEPIVGRGEKIGRRPPQASGGSITTGGGSESGGATDKRLMKRQLARMSH